MKKLIYLAGLAGMLFIMNSCTATGYVADEPSYVEYSRPARPSEFHIWIDGDWIYNRQTQRYDQGRGYWGKPRGGKTYISGSWRTTSQGHRWESGHWQR